jgi:hypothetical protein
VAQPGAHVWSLTKGDHRLSCELRDHGDASCEAQLFRDGEFYKGRHLPTPAAALAHVDAVRTRLEHEGWSAVAAFRKETPCRGSE